jgi:glycosyltransferase involved in cell wall biosynthesis
MTGNDQAANGTGVLFVSKPLVPPWTDSGKNLARDIAAAGERYRYHVLGTPGADPPGPRATVEPVYSDAGIYAAGIKQNIPVFKRLLKPDRLPLYHFFFAPNRRTSQVAKSVLFFKRRKTVHTICSVPTTFEGIDRILFADRMVVLSRDTQGKLEAHTRRPVVHIPPCVPVDRVLDETRKRQALEALGLPLDRPVVLFAGDYEFSDAATICLQALPRIFAGSDAHFLFAVRIKREPSRQAEARIRDEVRAMGLAERVHFHNEVDDMEALAAAVTLNVMPADSLYAKMDIPLVLLESLREGVPVVVSDHGPLAELLDRDVGAAVPTGDAEAFGDAVAGLLQDEAARNAKGETGRKRVRETYAPAPVAAAYEALYDDLLGPAPGQR